MRKILGLLFVAMPLFSMQIELMKPAKIQAQLPQCIENNESTLDRVQIISSLVRAPEKLGAVELYHENKGFSILHSSKEYKVERYFTDPILRDITRKQLSAFLSAGYLYVNQMDNGDFSLQAKGKLVGGGPIFGAFMYCLTKSVCYGTALAAVGTVAVGTGGTAVMLATGGVATAGGVAIGTAATTATMIGGTTTAVVGSQAALATAAAVTSAGGVAATVAAVESFSAAVGTFFGMLPTP